MTGASHFEKLIRDGRPFLLFGAGQNAQEWLRTLAQSGVRPAAIIDETPSKQGRFISGIKVVSPEVALDTWSAQTLVLVTVFVPRVSYRFLKEKLESFGFSNVHSICKLVSIFPGKPFYYFVGGERVDEIGRASKALARNFIDPISNEHLEAFIQAQGNLDPSLAASPRPQDYFLGDLISPPSDLIYVDAGAYQGDTVEKCFTEARFSASQIWALEPDPRNFSILSKYVSDLPEERRRIVRLENKAVGHRKAKVRFDVLGNASSHISRVGAEEVDMVNIDSIIGPKCSCFVKFDVEGAELNALAGCETLVRQGSSAIAVSVYHHPEHLMRAGAFLLDRFPNVQLFFRTLDENGMDSMLYAIPKRWIQKSQP